MSAEPTSAKPPLRLILVLGLLSMVPPLAIDMYLPGFPLMAGELGVPAATIQLTLTGFLLGLAAGQLVIGPLSDRLGRRRLLVTGTIGCLVASALTALAPNAGILIVARFFQGFTGAAAVVLARAIVADVSRGSQAARLFSLMMTIGGIAPIVAPLLGGALLGWVGWRGVLWTLAGLTGVMTVAAFLGVPETLPPERRAQGGFSQVARNFRLVLSNRVFLGYALTIALSFSALFSYLSASPFVYQVVLGVTPDTYARLFTLNSMGLVGASTLSGFLAGRVEVRTLLHGGLTSMLVGAGSLLTAVWLGAAPLVVGALIFVSVASLGFVFGNATALATAQVRAQVGTGSAVIGAMQFTMGSVVAPVVALGGSDTALPMAVAMLCAGLLAATVLTLLTRPLQQTVTA